MTTPTTTNTLRDLLGLVRNLSDAAADAVASAFESIDSVADSPIADLTSIDGVGKTLAGRIRHAARAARNIDPTDIASLRHGDERTLIPTDEMSHLIDITGDGEADVVVYDRDPDLDPQLVWRGKDKQDLEGLQVGLKAIYRQEHIDPRAIVALRKFTGRPG